MRDWILVVFTFIVIGLFFAFSVQTDIDFYWHLSLGRFIWQTRSIPITDPFIYGSSNSPQFVSVEWLSGLIYYVLFSFLGISGIVILRVVQGLLTLFLFYKTLELVVKNNLVRLSFVAFTGYVLAYRMYDRPETFSFLFLALISYLGFFIYIKGKVHPLSWILPVVFLAWPNLHGVPVMGVGLILWYLFLIVSSKSFKLSKESKKFILIVLASVFLSVIQTKKFFYFAWHLTNPPPVGEFQTIPDRLFSTHGIDLLNQVSWHIWIYFLCLGASVLLLIFSLTKRSNKLIILISVTSTVLLLTPLKISRLIPPIILITIPLLSLVWKELISYKKLGKAPVVFLIFVNTIIFLSILSGSVIGSKEDSQIIRKGKEYYVINRFWYPVYPDRAPKFINSYLNSKRLFTSTSWSNYLLWYSPKIKIFSDILWDYRTENDLKNLEYLKKGKGNWRELIKKFDIDTVVNTFPYHFHLNNTPVYSLKNWQLVYIDGNAIVYAREDIIKNLPFDLSAINPYSPRLLKIKPLQEETGVLQLRKLLEFDNLNEFAREQLIMYFMTKSINKAFQLSHESRELIPKNPNFSAYLAVIYSVKGECDKAVEYENEAKQKSFGYLRVAKQLESYIKNCQTKF